MGLLGLVLLCCGVFGIACGSKCVAGTAKCSKYWVKIEPHTNLMESEEELDSWCRKQPQFYKCLEDVLLADKNGNMSYLPTDLLISKLFAEDLCTDGSTNRMRYLNNAACINQLNTEFCIQPAYLDIVTLDTAVSPNGCSVTEKAFSCIAASMVMNCGVDAGKVYRTLLKIIRYSDEVCDIDVFPGIQPCGERRDTSQGTKEDQEFPGIYYGLVDRIGSIPEQENDIVDPVVSNAVEESAERDCDVCDDAVESNSEEFSIDAVTEVIKSALDDLEQDSFFEEGNVESDELYSAKSGEQLVEEYDYKKHPILLSNADSEAQIVDDPEALKYELVTDILDYMNDESNLELKDGESSVPVDQSVRLVLLDRKQLLDYASKLVYDVEILDKEADSSNEGYELLNENVFVRRLPSGRLVALDYEVHTSDETLN